MRRIGVEVHVVQSQSYTHVVSCPDPHEKVESLVYPYR